MRSTRRTPSQEAGRHGLYLSAEVHEAQREADQVSLTAEGYAPLSPAWVETLMGFPVGWTDPAIEHTTSAAALIDEWRGWPARPGEAQYDYEPPRLARGIEDRAKRLKALGNAVVPQQAYPIFAAISAVEAQRKEECKAHG